VLSLGQCERLVRSGGNGLSDPGCSHANVGARIAAGSSVQMYEAANAKVSIA
jgi:hypothetical protein